ncbi:ATP-binding protein [Nocardia sp. NPDC050406]|uniref:HAMP domain-containing sensor histidine kinase n=1 Tax=Nocardia sp. NPDC050406 TaxID=3364318 RepID=UPI0037922AA1
MSFGLRARTAVYFVLAMAVALAGMAAAAYVVLGHELEASLDRGLRREATRIARQFDTEPSVATISGPCRYLAAPSCVQVVAADGRIESEYDPDQALPVDGETRSVAAGSARPYFADITVEGYPMRMYTAPLRPGSAVQIAQRSDTVDTSLHRVGLALLTAAAAGIVVAAVAGTLLARRALAPVTTLTRTAEQVARTRDPGQHIEVTGADELARLAASFNTMLTELDAALAAERDSRAAQRRLIADASHELRTPLTALRTNIDLLGRAARLTPEQRDETLRALHAQAAEMSGLVTDLIDLARADDPTALPEPGEDLRLDTVVTTCVDIARRHWPAIVFDAHLEPTTVFGVPARLSRAVTNLLDNAAKFSPDHAVVRVRLSNHVLAVHDQGPGIATEDLPHVFDRFYRSPAARSTPGHGLGLAIVAQVAAAHGADLTVDSAPGRGAVFRLRFPDRS